MTAFTDVEEQRRAEQAARERDVAQARAEELRVARRRIIEAADAARAQLERDLHDGAQQQFVSAMLQLQLAERTGGVGPGRRARAARAGDRAGEARASTSCAGSPPGSTRRSSPTAGSAPAVESLASRLPLPVSVVRTPDVRLPARGRGQRLLLRLRGADQRGQARAGARGDREHRAPSNGELTVEVGDDGVGGAQDAGGSGLRGLGDRVAALDGTLEVESPPGGGTTLRARDPVRERRGAAGVRPGVPDAGPVAADQVGAFAFDHSALWTRLAAW